MGIFYDYLNTENWKADFDFTKKDGETFLSSYKKIVNRTPTKKELKRMVESVRELERQFVVAKETGQKNKAMAAVCHALLNSAAFFHVD